MKIVDNLKKISADLKRATEEEPVNADTVRLAARRIGTQVEMMELGLDDD